MPPADFASLTPLAGGFSGETFVADAGGERVVVGVYARPSSRGAAAPEVDAALLRLVRGLLPVPVDPGTLAVTGLVDWEYAHAGHPFTDLGNLLRFERDPAFTEAVLTAYAGRRAVDSLRALALARAADLWALVDLAGRRNDNPWPLGRTVGCAASPAAVKLRHPKAASHPQPRGGPGAKRARTEVRARPRPAMVRLVGPGAAVDRDETWVRWISTGQVRVRGRAVPGAYPPRIQVCAPGSGSGGRRWLDVARACGVGWASA